MGRIGVRTKNELQEVEQLIRENPMLVFEGIYTHFATADEIDQTYYQQQSAVFKEMLESLQEQPELFIAVILPLRFDSRKIILMGFGWGLRCMD